MATNLNDYFFSSPMAHKFGLIFSTFSTLGKYYIRRALSEAKCSASEAMTGIGREGKGNSRAFNLKICFKYPFKTNRVHIKFLPSWPCKFPSSYVIKFSFMVLPSVQPSCRRIAKITEIFTRLTFSV